MAALYDEDPSRWTATTLASRYSAPPKNVEAFLRLVKLRRKGWAGKKSKEEIDRLDSMRADMLKTWARLAEPRAKRGAIAPPSPSLKDASEIPGEMEVEEVEEEVQEIVVKEKSRTFKWLEETIADAAKDRIRKNSFAFIEVGEGAKGKTRAVWIREGSTGDLRLAREQERSVLLDEVRSTDPSVWK